MRQHILTRVYECGCSWPLPWPCSALISPRLEDEDAFSSCCDRHRRVRAPGLRAAARIYGRGLRTCRTFHELQHDAPCFRDGRAADLAAERPVLVSERDPERR